MEAMNMIRKGQVQGVDKGDVRSQVELVSNFWSYCLIESKSSQSFVLE